MNQILIKSIYLQKFKARYQLLINKRESTGLKHLNYSKSYIEYSSDMDDIYKNKWIISFNWKTKNIDCI